MNKIDNHTFESGKSVWTANDVTELEFRAIDSMQDIIDESEWSGIVPTCDVVDSAGDYIQQIAVMLENDPNTLCSAMDDLNLLLDDIRAANGTGVKMSAEQDGSMLAMQALTTAVRS